MIQRPSFWFASLLALATPAPAQDTPAQDTPAPQPPAVIEIVRRLGDEQSATAAFRIQDSDLIATVLGQPESSDTWFVARVGDDEFPADPLLYDHRSRLALFRSDRAPSRPLPTAEARSLSAPASLQALPPEGDPQPVRHAGEVQMLAGRPLLLTLIRLHAGASVLESGSPVLTPEGALAAVVLSPLEGVPGAWLALPADAVRKLTTDFQKWGDVDTGQLEVGIPVGTTTAVVEFVQPESRAQRAGIHPGDVILRIGQRPIHNSLDVLDANFYLNTRQPVPLQILRGLELLELTAPAKETE